MSNVTPTTHGSAVRVHRPAQRGRWSGSGAPEGPSVRKEARVPLRKVSSACKGSPPDWLSRSHCDLSRARLVQALAALRAAFGGACGQREVIAVLSCSWCCPAAFPSSALCCLRLKHPLALRVRQRRANLLTGSAGGWYRLHSKLFTTGPYSMCHSLRLLQENGVENVVKRS